MTDAPPGGGAPKRRTLSDWLALAERYFREGDVDKAEQLLTKLLSAQPNHPHLLNLLGNLCLDGDRLDEAVDLFRRALASAGPSPSLLANLGRALERGGELDDALAAFEEAVALDPENPGGHYHLGVTYQRHGRFSDAADAFERAIALGATDARAHNAQGAALQSLGRLDEAIDCYEEALRREPEHAESLNNLAIIHQMKGQHDRAIALLQRSVALQPTVAESQLNLARALIDADRLVEAEPIVERSLSLRPHFAEAEFARGQILEKTGRLAEAHAAFLEAVDVRPDHLPSRLHLARLSRRLVPRWHFPMLNDAVRNAGYDAGIRSVVSEGAVVLDIGTGSGLLAMMAARAGAKHVYGCETVPLIAQVAERVIAKNGLGDQITVIPKTSTDLVVGEDLPERADVLVCEIFDTGLLSEGVVPVLEHARRELVKPGALVLPRGATVVAQLVQSSALRDEEQVSTASGFDLSEFNAFADVTYGQRDVTQFEHRALSAPFEVFTFDFTGPPILDERRQLDVPVIASGRCDAIVFWFVLDLDGEHTVSTAPDVSSCWRQAVQVVDAAALEAGDAAAVTATHDGNMIFFEVA